MLHIKGTNMRHCDNIMAGVESAYEEEPIDLKQGITERFEEPKLRAVIKERSSDIRRIKTLNPTKPLEYSSRRRLKVMSILQISLKAYGLVQLILRIVRVFNLERLLQRTYVRQLSVIMSTAATPHFENYEFTDPESTAYLMRLVNWVHFPWWNSCSILLYRFEHLLFLNKLHLSAVKGPCHIDPGRYIQQYREVRIWQTNQKVSAQSQLVALNAWAVRGSIRVRLTSDQPHHFLPASSA